MSVGVDQARQNCLPAAVDNPPIASWRCCTGPDVLDDIVVDNQVALLVKLFSPVIGRIAAFSINIDMSSPPFIPV